jgi:amidase
MSFLLSDEHRIYSMSPDNEPAMQVVPGSEVVFITRDCFDGSVDWSRFPDCLDDIDGTKVNPATGPLAIEGSEPGGTLSVRILSIEVMDAGFANRLRFPVADGKADLPASIVVPVEPVIGVIGVAPAEGKITNRTPGNHGGNLDTRSITVGATVYLPIQVEGALLAMGDVHALQGDGEVCGQGIEIGAEVKVRVDLTRRDLPKRPVVETPSHICIVSSAETLDQASDDAISVSGEWLAHHLGVSERESHAILSLVCDLRISQVVNPLKTVRMCIPKHILRWE